MTPVQVTPVYLKLGALVVKQVSKPVAAQLKSSALAHPSLREALRAVGQRMHEYNATLTQRLKTEGELASGRKVFVTRLDDETAMKKAADFMAEVFIFSVRLWHGQWSLGANFGAGGGSCSGV